MPRFESVSPLAPAALDSIIAELNARVVDLLVVYVMAKHAHWNVGGMSFGPLHKLFGDVADAMSEQADVLAERLVMLGGEVNALDGVTLVEPYPAGVVGGEEHCRALADRLNQLDVLLYGSAEAIEDAGDPFTFDVITSTIQALEKLTWTVLAHLKR